MASRARGCNAGNGMGWASWVKRRLQVGSRQVLCCGEGCHATQQPSQDSRTQAVRKAGAQRAQDTRRLSANPCNRADSSECAGACSQASRACQAMPGKETRPVHARQDCPLTEAHQRRGRGWRHLVQRIQQLVSEPRPSALAARAKHLLAKLRVAAQRHLHREHISKQCGDPSMHLCAMDVHPLPPLQTR